MDEGKSKKKRNVNAKRGKIITKPTLITDNHTIIFGADVCFPLLCDYKKASFRLSWLGQERFRRFGCA